MLIFSHHSFARHYRPRPIHPLDIVVVPFLPLLSASPMVIRLWLSWLVLTGTKPSLADAFAHRVQKGVPKIRQKKSDKLCRMTRETNLRQVANDTSYLSRRESKASSWNSQQEQSRRESLLQMPRYCLATLFGLALGVPPTMAATISDTSLKLCQTGALMPEQAITGAYEQECMSLPEREIPYTDIRQRTSGTLRIQQGTAGAGTTGLAVWNSSLLLSRLLQQLAISDWSSRCVLELGCGTGLASLTAAALGANKVLATDGNPAVVTLAEQNIRDNGLSDRVQAQLLPWSFMNALDYADGMDLVVGSDLTYQSQNWPALAETMATVVKPRTGLVLYLTLGHAGFAVQAELQGFLAVAQQYGLVPVVDAATVGLPTTDLTRLVYEKCIHREELPIVQSTGGVRVLALQCKR